MSDMLPPHAEVPMTGSFRWFAAATAFVLVGSSAPAQNAAMIAPPFPAKAPVVVHLHGIERTKGRLLKMLGGLPPAEAQAAGKFLDDGFQSLFAGRKLSAIPPDGRIYLVIHDFTRFD